MLERLCRDAYEKYLIAPLLKIPAIHRCNPMHITTAACLIGISIAPLLYFGHTTAALLALLISGFLDTLDGSLSRYQNSNCALGAVWDIVCDRAVEFSVIFGLFLIDSENRALCTIGMLGSILLCISSFLVVGIFSEDKADKKKSFYYSPGIIERAEAFLFWIVMITVPKSYILLSWTFVFLVLLTTLIRLCQFSNAFARSQNLDT